MDKAVIRGSDMTGSKLEQVMGGRIGTRAVMGADEGEGRVMTGRRDKPKGRAWR